MDRMLKIMMALALITCSFLSLNLHISAVSPPEPVTKLNYFWENPTKIILWFEGEAGFITASYQEKKWVYSHSHQADWIYRIEQFMKSDINHLYKQVKGKVKSEDVLFDHLDKKKPGLEDKSIIEMKIPDMVLLVQALPATPKKATVIFISNQKKISETTFTESSTQVWSKGGASIDLKDLLDIDPEINFHASFKEINLAHIGGVKAKWRTFYNEFVHKIIRKEIAGPYSFVTTKGLIKHLWIQMTTQTGNFSFNPLPADQVKSKTPLTQKKTTVKKDVALKTGTPTGGVVGTPTDTIAEGVEIGFISKTLTFLQSNKWMFFFYGVMLIFGMFLLLPLLFKKISSLLPAGMRPLSTQGPQESKVVNLEELQGNIESILSQTDSNKSLMEDVKSQIPELITSLKNSEFLEIGRHVCQKFNDSDASKKLPKQNPIHWFDSQLDNSKKYQGKKVQQTQKQKELENEINKFREVIGSVLREMKPLVDLIVDKKTGKSKKKLKLEANTDNLKLGWHGIYRIIQDLKNENAELDKSISDTLWDMKSEIDIIRGKEKGKDFDKAEKTSEIKTLEQCWTNMKNLIDALLDNKKQANLVIGNVIAGMKSMEADKPDTNKESKEIKESKGSTLDTELNIENLELGWKRIKLMLEELEGRVENYQSQNATIEEIRNRFAKIRRIHKSFIYAFYAFLSTYRSKQTGTEITVIFSFLTYYSAYHLTDAIIHGQEEKEKTMEKNIKRIADILSKNKGIGDKYIRIFQNISHSLPEFDDLQFKQKWGVKHDFDFFFRELVKQLKTLTNADIGRFYFEFDKEKGKEEEGRKLFFASVS